MIFIFINTEIINLILIRYLASKWINIIYVLIKKMNYYII